MLSQYKKHLELRLSAFAKTLPWVNPNMLTMLGLLPPILFLVFMSQGRFVLSICMLALTTLDLLDGIFARTNNKVTKFGGFLDSTLDRMSDFCIIGGLYAAGLAGATLTGMLLLSTFLISYTRLRAEVALSPNTTFNYGIMERGERIFAIGIIVLLHQIFPHTNIMGVSLTELLILIVTILCAYTALQRIFKARTLLS